jgi:nucleoside-diphosphate-sugar epimerase
MKKVFLTGGTGFVGKQIARALVQNGAEVTMSIRRDNSHLKGFHEFVQIADLFSEDLGFWRKTLSKFDIVVHAAWYAEPGKYLASSKNLDCLAGTLALAQGAVEAGVKKFVGVGTCFEYDLSNSATASQKPLSVSSPIAPDTTYGAAKASTWLTLSSFLRDKGVDFAWCRLFYLYGEGEDERRLAPYLHAQLSVGQPALLSSGTQVRDFMDVAEAGNRIALAALGPNTGALNICSGEAVTVADFAKKLAEQHGRPDLLRFGARPDNLSDPPYVVGEPSPIAQISTNTA